MTVLDEKPFVESKIETVFFATQTRQHCRKCDPSGIRTRVTAVRGRRTRPLYDGAVCLGQFSHTRTKRLTTVTGECCMTDRPSGPPFVRPTASRFALSAWIPHPCRWRSSGLYCVAVLLALSRPVGGACECFPALPLLRSAPPLHDRLTRPAGR